jgi:hypothetical protein
VPLTTAIIAGLALNLLFCVAVLFMIRSLFHGLREEIRVLAKRERSRRREVAEALTSRSMNLERDLSRLRAVLDSDPVRQAHSARATSSDAC